MVYFTSRIFSIYFAVTHFCTRLTLCCSDKGSKALKVLSLIHI